MAKKTINDDTRERYIKAHTAAQLILNFNVLLRGHAE